MSARFDAVVVGAGPGGVAVATVAAEAGLHVCLLDDNPSLGGQIWRGFHCDTAHKYPHGSEFLQWTSRLQRTSCEIWCGWQAIDQPEAGLLRLEREGELREIRYGKLILATGARERFLPFPGWTLPGVMGAGGLQALVKSGLDPTGKRIVVAGSGPLLLAVAAGLTKAGARIVSILEQAPLARLAGFGLTLFAQPRKIAEGVEFRLKTSGTPYRAGCWVVFAEGRGRVEQVEVTDGSTRTTLGCDWLACGFHLVPNLELPQLLGCRAQDGYVAVDSLQRTSIDDVFCVGELTGIGGLEKALVEGQIAGWAAAGRAAEAGKLAGRRQKLHRFAQRLDQAFALRPELRALAEPDTLVCRCEDVPHSALTQCKSWREAKLHTRCGMGACQGRVCGAAANFLFGWNCAGQRPPLFPASVDSIAAGVDQVHS